MKRRMLRMLICATACAVLSSCYTRVHQYVWQKAKVAEGAEWLDDQNNIELFSDGKHIYAKGNQGQMRGCYKHSPYELLVPLHGVGGHAYYAPIQATATAIYYRLSAADAAKVRKAAATGKKYVNIEPAPGQAAPLPAAAKPLKIKGKTTVSYPMINGESLERADVSEIPYTTDAHKYYAYPLGVLTAVAVDAPLTLAGNAVALGAAAVGAVTITPFAGLYHLYDACTQEAPETADSSTTSAN